MKKHTHTSTVLLCDDDEGIADVTKIVLEDLGYKVVTASNGEEVMPAVKAHKPSLILLDLWMPIMSGEEILLQLKKTPKYKDIPVIVVSASKDTEQVALRAKADSFLSKPFDISALEEMVRRYVRH